MGLGILFFGYVLVSVFTLAPTYFITDTIGAYVIFIALGKLRRHAPRFRYAIAANYAFFAVAAVQTVYYSLRYIGVVDPVSIFENALEIVRLSILFIFTAALLLSLSQLASSVGDEKLAYKGKRNIWFFAASYILMIALSLDYPFLTDFKAAFSAFGLIFRLFCALLNCVYIYSCYMWICLESDHDMTKISAMDRFIGRAVPKKNKKEPDAEAKPAPEKPKKPEPAPIVHHKRKKK